MNTQSRKSSFFAKTFRLLAVLMVLFLIYTIYSIFSVPSLCELARKNPRTTAFMEMRREQWEDQKVKKKIFQIWVPLSSVSRHLKNAVLVAEDPNFYSHNGLDFSAIHEAIEQNWEEKEIVRGASTITQQLMKNLYLSSSRNPLRKWREAILSIRVERCVKKERILEIYLNVIEWGRSTYGAEAASRAYFGKSAAALNPAEAALLAAMIPNPVARNPYRSNRALLKKKNVVLKYMWKRRKISTSEYQAAINQTIDLR